MLLPTLIQVVHFMITKASSVLFLVAVADASYMFTYVNVGDYVRQCNSAVFNNSTFGDVLKNNTFNLPYSDFLPNITAKCTILFCRG